VSLLALPGTETPDAGPNLPDEFWTARPVLEHIRAAARARMAPPDAVLGAALARQGAYATPGDGVDLGIGRPTPFTVFAVLYGPPGAGKSVSMGVGRGSPPGAVLAH
jgi:hypothetical protein